MLSLNGLAIVLLGSRPWRADGGVPQSDGIEIPFVPRSSVQTRAEIAITEFLEANGYHPRSSKHGDALCRFAVQDLADTCPSFRSAAARGSIVFQSNYTIAPESPDRWNADLVIGPPVSPPTPTDDRIGPIAQGDPREIWVAIDTKTIMTEHGKARRNRQRDLNSFQDILHRKNRRTVVGGLLIVNVADRFQTPLARTEAGITLHRNIERLVKEIVEMMGALARADSAGTAQGLEALGIIVVSHTNVPGERTRLVTAEPAPPPGGRLSYGAFLKELCDSFSARYSTG